MEKIGVCERGGGWIRDGERDIEIKEGQTDRQSPVKNRNQNQLYSMDSNSLSSVSLIQQC